MSSLYLHIPFCRSKCPYCDFYSQVGSAEQVDEYVDLLILDMQILAEVRPLTGSLQTIFFGGGTPSLLTAEQVDRLLRQSDRLFRIDTNCEISLEANPGAVDESRLRGYRSAGVNRLSLGVQSLCDHQLKLLGRGHTVADVRDSVALARNAGFSNLNLDLMFARPQLTGEQLRSEVGDLLALQPQHVSLYGLSYESGTRFAELRTRRELVEASDEEYAGQYGLIHDRLAEGGFEHYEISNFALPGFRCRHNQGYWRRDACLSVGCGGHSFVPAGWGERWAVPADLNRYRRCLINHRDPAQRLETFDRQGAMIETLYLALRTRDGVDCQAFAEKFGGPPEELFPDAFRRLADHLRRSGNRWFFEPSSWLIYDHLISAFF
ncbi:MAG: radical SAM family heme chaperone HemW [Desulfuromonadales bacterium]|nr:radical SAM family heme chaperone HemW [Desulfuromonadales bacterium]